METIRVHQQLIECWIKSIGINLNQKELNAAYSQYGVLYSNENK